MGRCVLDDERRNNDYNLPLVCLLLTAAAVLAANILPDAAYSWLDLRVSLQGAAG